MDRYAGNKDRKLRVGLANAMKQAICVHAKQQSQNHHIHVHGGGAMRKAMEREMWGLELAADGHAAADSAVAIPRPTLRWLYRRTCVLDRYWHFRMATAPKTAAQLAAC